MPHRIAACALGLLTLGGQLAPAAEPKVSIVLGEQELVLADGQHGLHYFPDECLTFLPQSQGARLVMAANVQSVMLEGPSLKMLGAPRDVLRPGKPGSFDNGYAGISTAWHAPSGQWLAVYHAEDQEGMPVNDAGIPGFYCRVALALSSNDGSTFEKIGPVVSGHLPKVAGGRFDQGVGEPCLIAEPGEKFLYVYYSSHERIDGRGVRICLARAPASEAMRPAAWLKWHDGAFVEPGLGGQDTPVVNAIAERTDTLFPHVVYSPVLQQFVMIYCVHAWQERAQPGTSGFYAAFSEDGIHWPKAAMQQIWKTAVIASLHAPVAWHPTLVLEEGTEEGEAKGWLYYGYSESWGHRLPDKPHYLVRRPITFHAQP
jgi:hypothetical protein